MYVCLVLFHRKFHVPDPGVKVTWLLLLLNTKAFSTLLHSPLKMLFYHRYICILYLLKKELNIVLYIILVVDCF